MHMNTLLHESKHEKLHFLKSPHFLKGGKAFLWFLRLMTVWFSMNRSKTYKACIKFEYGQQRKEAFTTFC